MERSVTSLWKTKPFDAFTSQPPVTFSEVVGGEAADLALLLFQALSIFNKHTTWPAVTFLTQQIFSAFSLKAILPVINSDQVIELSLAADRQIDMYFPLPGLFLQWLTEDKQIDESVIFRDESLLSICFAINCLPLFSHWLAALCDKATIINLQSTPCKNILVFVR